MTARVNLARFAARPVLKWAGGKSQLLPDLLRHMPAQYGSYHEPFVGGAALFFELASQRRLTASYLSDINPALVDVYLALRDCVDDVIRCLRQHRHEEAYYYRVRALHPFDLSLAERAARLIYLNKTCYNGLYRENRKGQFNVPFGRHKNPTICDEPRLRAASAVLQEAIIHVRRFSTVLEVARPNDFVYFDPPYHPVSATSSFTSYARDGFDQNDQRHLRDVCAELDRRGVKVLLSNSDTPFINEIYSDFRITRVFASRAINSKADSRGKISEVLVSNYEPVSLPSGYS